MADYLFNFEDLKTGKEPPKKLIAAFTRAGADIAASFVDTKARREAGISFREIVLTLSDGQILALRVKQTGDIYQARLNDKALPIKNQDDHKKAIAEMVGLVDANRDKFQKVLAKTKVDMPEGVKSTVKRQEDVLQARIAELSTSIEQAKKELADMGVTDSAQEDKETPVIGLDKAKAGVVATAKIKDGHNGHFAEVGLAYVGGYGYLVTKSGATRIVYPGFFGIKFNSKSDFMSAVKGCKYFSEIGESSSMDAAEPNSEQDSEGSGDDLDGEYTPPNAKNEAPVVLNEAPVVLDAKQGEAAEDKQSPDDNSADQGKEGAPANKEASSEGDEGDDEDALDEAEIEQYLEDECGDVSEEDAEGEAGQDVEGAVLDGDFPGHPFRGNQYKSASSKSKKAWTVTAKAKKLEKSGTPKQQQRAHTTAHKAHKLAAKESTGAARVYHSAKAKEHKAKALKAARQGMR